MVKVREVKNTEQKKIVTALDNELKAEQFGNDALPKTPRKKPANQYKAISIPFTKEGYDNLVLAAEKADRKPTDFIKRAIQKAVEAELKKK